MYAALAKSMVAIAAGIAVTPALARAEAGDDQYAVAAGHYDQKRWKLAGDEFRTFLADHSDDPRADRALFYLAESLVQLRQFDEAAAHYRDFRRRAPDDRHASKALFRAGEASYWAGAWEAADRDLRQFLAEAADDRLCADALAYLGDIALRTKDAATAQELFTAGLARVPPGPVEDDCRFGLARALEEQGQHAEARRLYLALSAQATGRWADDAQLRLGVSQFAAGEYNAAVETLKAFETTFRASPCKDEAELAGGQALYYLEQYDAAKGRFEALADRPDLGPQARYWVGLTQKAQHEWAGASQTLLAAAALAEGQPVEAAMRFHAGDALLRSGKTKEADEQFDLVAAAWPDSEFVDDSLLGKLHSALANGSHEAVDRLAEEFTRRFSASDLVPTVERALARSLLARRQYGRAIEVLESPAAPDQPPTPSLDKRIDRYLLAVAYQGGERYGDALAALEPVLAEATGELKSDAERVQATALVALGRFAQATRPLEACLAANPPEDAAAWCHGQLAICFARTHQLDRARQAYSALVAGYRAHPLVRPTTAALAEIALAEGDSQWSAELFAALTAGGNPPQYLAEGLSGMAWNQYKAGDLPLAADTFGRLLSTCADEAPAAEAALMRGRILDELEQTDGALAMYHLVIDKYPCSQQVPPALLGAARLHDRLEQDADAAALYERLVAEFPELPERDAALYEWAWVLWDLGQPAEAEALFERLRSAEPRGRFWADAVYRLSERAWETKQYGRADQLLSELISSDPGAGILPHALYLQAQVALSRERWADAVGLLERLTCEFSESPLRPRAEYWIAEAAFRQGDYTAAGERFERLATQMTGSRETWFAMISLRRAQMLARQKKWSEALEIAERIEADHPGFEEQYEVDYLRGRCLASQGQFDRARDAYGKVTASKTGGKTETAAMAQWMIGESYFHQKKYQMALSAYLRLEILYAYPTWQAGALVEAGKCHELLGEWREAGELYTRLLKAYPQTAFTDEAARRLEEAHQRAQAKDSS